MLSANCSRRVIRPLEIEAWDQTLTLTGWCETREDFRVFRLDLISSAHLTERGFKPDIGRPLKDYPESLSDKNERTNPRRNSE
ncbi:WYL domain-containing protein [Sulfitobacter indolifex]|uniref:WYL domain-containing protein n=1 Tax=Sulfitobacter indolifex TaxID=225422 RepID=UPI0002E438BA|nr:WYL domain-containing protein [Sulfitobacter indolifex]